MKRFTKKLSNDKAVLCKIYEHYVDSFDVDIIYDYQSERAEECGNKFYYGELIEKLAEYENTNLTPQEIMELKKENEELKQQLAEQVKTVNIERIEIFDNRKRWNSNDSRRNV